MNELVNVLERRFTLQILMALDEHGSMNISKLSKTVNGGASTILKRVKEMEDVGLVSTYTPLTCYQRIAKNTVYGATIISNLYKSIEEGWDAQIRNAPTI